MRNRNRIVAAGMALILCFAAVGGLAQDQPVASPDMTQTPASVIDQILTFIDSASTYLGQGVVYVLNLIAGDDPNTGLPRIPSTLEKPIGYLAFITVILLLFGLLDFARKIIWIGIIVGWVLLIIRIILDALGL
jgi:hypothetical protein